MSLQKRTSAPPQDWLTDEAEAQLSIDVFRDGDSLVVRSPVAGVAPEDVDISVNGDLLTIRGSRSIAKNVSEDDWFYRENYWGRFSRSIVLPFDVASDKATAKVKNGLLEVRIPIREHAKKVSVKWEG